MGVTVRRIAGDSLVYGLTGLATPILGLFTVPFVARSLTTAEYGVLELVMTTVYLAAVFLDMGLSSAMFRYFLDVPPDQRESRREIVSSALGLMFSSSLAIALVSIAISGPIGNALGDGGRTIVILASVTLPLTTLAQLTRETMRLQFKPWRFFASALLGAIPTAVLAVVAVTWLDLGVSGVVGAGVVGLVASSSYGLVQARQLLGARFSSSAISRMLAFGLPLVPGTLSIWGMAYADRLILGAFSGVDEVGIYAIANRITQPVGLLASALTIAYYPLMFDLARDRPEYERVVRRYMGRASLLLGLCLSLVLAAAAPELISILAPGYDRAAQVVGTLGIGLSLYSLVSVLVGSFLVMKRTGLTAVFCILAAVLNIGLCVSLVPAFGAAGAATGTACGYAFLAGMYLRFGVRNEPEAHDVRRLLMAFLIGVIAIALTGIIIETTSGFTSLLLRMACVGAFGLATLAFGVISPRHVTRVLRELRGATTP